MFGGGGPGRLLGFTLGFRAQCAFLRFMEDRPYIYKLISLFNLTIGVLGLSLVK
jgi:hypothetical protein